MWHCRWFLIFLLLMLPADSGLTAEGEYSRDVEAPETQDGPQPPGAGQDAADDGQNDQGSSEPEKAGIEATSSVTWNIEYVRPGDDWRPSTFRRRYPTEATDEPCQIERLSIHDEEDGKPVRLTLAARYRVEIIQIRASQHLREYRLILPGRPVMTLALPLPDEAIRQTYSFFPLCGLNCLAGGSQVVDIRIVYAISRSLCYSRRNGAVSRVAGESSLQDEKNYPGLVPVEGFSCMASILPSSQQEATPEEATASEHHMGVQTDLMFVKAPSFCQLSQQGVEETISLGNAAPLQDGDGPVAVFIHQYFYDSGEGEEESWTDIYLVSGSPMLVPPPEEEQALLPALVDTTEELPETSSEQPPEEVENPEVKAEDEWPDLDNPTPPKLTSEQVSEGVQESPDLAKSSDTASSDTSPDDPVIETEPAALPAIVQTSISAQPAPQVEPPGETVKPEEKKKKKKAQRQTEPAWEPEMSGYRLLYHLNEYRTYMKLVMLLQNSRPPPHHEWLRAFKAEEPVPESWQYYEGVVLDLVQQLEDRRTVKVSGLTPHKVFKEQEIAGFFAEASIAIENDAKEKLRQRIAALNGATEEYRPTREKELYQEFRQYLESVFRIKALAALIGNHFKASGVYQQEDIFDYAENVFTLKLLDGLQDFSVAVHECGSCRLPTNLRFLMLTVIDKRLEGWIKSCLDNGTLGSGNALTLLETLWPEQAVAGMLRFSSSLEDILIMAVIHFNEEFGGHVFFQKSSKDPVFAILHRMFSFLFLLVKSTEHLRYDSHNSVQATASLIDTVKLMTSLLKRRLQAAGREYIEYADGREKMFKSLQSKVQQAISLLGNPPGLVLQLNQNLKEFVEQLQTDTAMNKLIYDLLTEADLVKSIDTEAIRKYRVTLALSEGADLVRDEEARLRKEADRAAQRREKEEAYRKRLIEERFNARKKQVDDLPEVDQQRPEAMAISPLDQQIEVAAGLLQGVLRTPLPSDRHIKNVLAVYQGLLPLASNPFELFRAHALVADAYHAIAGHQNAGKAEAIDRKVENYQREVDAFLSGQKDKDPGKEAKDEFWKQVERFAGIIASCSDWVVEGTGHINIATSYLGVRDLEEQKAFLAFVDDYYEEMMSWIRGFKLTSERICTTSQKVKTMLKQLHVYGRGSRGGWGKSRETLTQESIEQKMKEMEDSLKMVDMQLQGMEFKALQLHDITAVQGLESQIPEPGKKSRPAGHVEEKEKGKAEQRTRSLDDNALEALLGQKRMKLLPVRRDHNCYFEALLAASGRTMDQQTLRALLVMILRIIKDGINKAAQGDQQILLQELAILMGGMDDSTLGPMEAIDHLLSQSTAFIAGGSESYWGDIHFTPFMVMALNSNIVQWLPDAEGQLIAHSMNMQSWDNAPGLLQLLLQGGLTAPDDTAPTAHIVHNGTNHFHGAVTLEQVVGDGAASAQASLVSDNGINPEGAAVYYPPEAVGFMMAPVIFMMNFLPPPGPK